MAVYVASLDQHDGCWSWALKPAAAVLPLAGGVELSEGEALCALREAMSKHGAHPGNTEVDPQAASDTLIRLLS